MRKIKNFILILEIIFYSEPKMADNITHSPFGLLKYPWL